MDSKFKTYYKVKPEFDQCLLCFKVNDKRFKNNFRLDQITLIAGELFTREQYIRILRGNSFDMSDIFNKVKCKSYISFGCRFDESYEFDYHLVDLLCDRRKELLKQFLAIYEKYCRIVKGSFMHITQKIYCNYLSIETLEFLIRYCGDLIN